MLGKSARGRGQDEGSGEVKLEMKERGKNQMRMPAGRSSIA